MSIALLIGDQVSVVLPVFVIALCTALVMATSFRLIATALIIPILPIATSHFVIEPFPDIIPINFEAKEGAIVTWFRLCGMTLLSIAWIKSLRVDELARLARVLWLGQYLFTLALMSTSTFRVAAVRWRALREMLSLQRKGRLAARRRVGVAASVPLGLQLTLASLVLTTDTALAAEGRGIGGRRTLGIRAPRLTIAGIIMFIASAGFATAPHVVSLHAWLR